MNLNRKESYEVMLQFLKNWYRLTQNKDITDILSGAQYWEDGKPLDSSFPEYWDNAIDQVKAGENDPFGKFIKEK